MGKERFLEWQEKLARHGVASISLDFPGVGDSSGTLTDSSLGDRVETVLSLYKEIVAEYSDKSLILCGVSMGGYVALGVVNKLPGVFEKLVLYAPAAYSKNSHHLHFGESFRQEIRSPNSWRDSSAFEWLQNYQGEVMMIYGSNDEVIPEEIVSKYTGICKEKDNCQEVFIEDMPHTIWSDKENDKIYREEIFKHILSFVL